MFNKIKNLWIWIFFGIVFFILALLKFQAGDFNNYLIFKASFGHLLQGQNLYLEYPQEHSDFFKYSPTFALLMAPFYFLPNLVGSLAWMMFSYVIFVWSLFKVQIPNVTIPRMALNPPLVIFLICLPELIGNLQNFQTNSLLVSLFLFVFYFLKDEKPILAGLLLALSVHIKLFGIVLLLLGFLFPKPWKFWFSSLASIAVLALLPLVILSPSDLISQYSSWLRLLRWDNAGSLGISIMGVFHALTNLKIPNFWFQFIGGLVLVFPFLRYYFNSGRSETEFEKLTLQLLFFSSLLIWLILFNHKSESPTYIIGVMGLAIWFVLEKSKPIRKIGLFFSLFFISFLYSDLVTPEFKKSFVHAYELKAWPLIFLWVFLQTKLNKNAIR